MVAGHIQSRSPRVLDLAGVGMGLFFYHASLLVLGPESGRVGSTL